MELEPLRVFVAVAQTRTFVEAAARLNKSQPAVTMTVKALEREMGVPLFEWEGRGKCLTAAGAGTRFQSSWKTFSATWRARMPKLKPKFTARRWAVYLQWQAENLHGG